MPKRKLYEDVKLISIDSIKPSPFENPNEFSEELFESLKKDIETNGLIANAIVVNPKDNSVIDGNHRLQIMKELGYEKVPVVFFEPEDETEHKILSVSFNQKRGTFNEQRLHNLLKDIFDSGKYSLEELKTKLGFNLSELREKLETIKVDENLIRKLEQEAAENEENALVPLNFVVSKRQEKIILGAMETAEGRIKADKLEHICSEFLSMREADSDEN